MEKEWLELKEHIKKEIDSIDSKTQWQEKEPD